VQIVVLFFVFIIENAQYKKQKQIFLCLIFLSAKERKVTGNVSDQV